MKVWETLTNPDLVRKWQYGSDLVTDWDVGGEVRFRTGGDGKTFEQWGKVLDVRSNQLLKYSLFAPGPDLEDKPENYFIMAYVLTPDGASTGLEIIPEDNRPGAVQEEPQGEEKPRTPVTKK